MSASHDPRPGADDLASAGLLTVEIAFVRTETVRRVLLRLAPGTTVTQALRAAVDAGVVSALEIDGRMPAVFGRLRAGDYSLHDGDRLELLGPFRADPRDARRRRVEAARATLSRDKWRAGGPGASG